MYHESRSTFFRRLVYFIFHRLWLKYFSDVALTQIFFSSSSDWASSVLRLRDSSPRRQVRRLLRIIQAHYCHHYHSVSLRCNATGVPTPTIAWHKSVGTAHGGHVACGGTCFTIPHVDLATSGDYICSAVNGVGHPQHATITLHVLCEYKMFFRLWIVKYFYGNIQIILFLKIIFP